MWRVYFILLLIILNFGYARNHTGLWVVRYALQSADEVDNILQTADQLDITDLYVQVRALGHVYYNSRQTMQHAGQVNGDGVLQNLIRKAKTRGLRVHAWINVLYIWSGSAAPDSEQHLFYLAEDALVRKPGQDQIPGYGELKSAGIEGYFVDPLNRQNINQINLLIKELIEKYNVDGIHLDYLRYPELNYSFSPAGRTAFLLRYYVDPAKFYLNQNKFISERGLRSYMYVDDLYKNFLRDNIARCLTEIRDHIRMLDENVVLSVAVKPDPDIARQKYFQDWGSWLKKDLCDRVLLMNYQTDFALFKNNVSEALKANDQKRLIIGISTYNQDEAAVSQRINYVSKLSTGGYAIFSYNYLAENKTFLRNLILYTL